MCVETLRVSMQRPNRSACIRLAPKHTAGCSGKFPGEPRKTAEAVDRRVNTLTLWDPKKPPTVSNLEGARSN